jgi:hypothetical protein
LGAVAEPTVERCFSSSLREGIWIKMLRDDAALEVMKVLLEYIASFSKDIWHIFFEVP